MRGHRKILLGALAALVPVTSFAVFGAPAILSGASSPVFPIACKVAANVAFSPALTKAGTHTTNAAAVTTVTISAGKLSACLSAAPQGAPNKGTLPTMTVRIPATSLGRIGGVRTFETGDCPTFLQSGTLKVLRGLKFNVAWSGSGVTGSSLFTTKQATTATNTSGEVGFTFSGKEGTGLYPEKSLNQITAFFDATTSAALSAQCSTSQTVSSATIVANASVAIL